VRFFDRAVCFFIRGAVSPAMRFIVVDARIGKAQAESENGSQKNRQRHAENGKLNCGKWRQGARRGRLGVVVAPVAVFVLVAGVSVGRVSVVVLGAMRVIVVAVRVVSVV